VTAVRRSFERRRKVGPSGPPIHRQIERAAVDRHTALDDHRDPLRVGNVGERVGVEQDHVGQLAGLDGPEIAIAAEEDGGVQRADANGLERRDAAGDHQLQLAVRLGACRLVGTQHDHTPGGRDQPQVLLRDRRHHLHPRRPRPGRVLFAGRGLESRDGLGFIRVAVDRRVEKLRVLDEAAVALANRQR
jgi:hypothetical protein